MEIPRGKKKIFSYIPHLHFRHLWFIPTLPRKYHNQRKRRLKLLCSYESHRCTVHFVKSLQLLTNKCTYITFTSSTLKHLKPLRLVSIFSDHRQRVSSFLAKVITYSRFSSFFVNKVLWQHIMSCRNLL